MIDKSSEKTGKKPRSAEILKLSKEDIAALNSQIERSDLDATSKAQIIHLISLVLSFRELLERRTGRLLSILRKIFGLKTEKSGKKSNSNKSDPSDKKGRRGGGSGRNGKDDYPGANKIEVKHECLKPGDPCPACATGKLTESEPGVAYRWFGQQPLVLNMYFLQRLICHACKDIFTAALPGTKSVIITSPSSPDESTLIVKERDFAPSAAATIATLRFEAGVPHFRLAEIQNQQGTPLAPATQFKVMTEALEEPANAVVGELEKIAGRTGKLFINDDTRARIMEIERGEPAAAPTAEDEFAHRKKVQTSAIVVQCEEHTISLHQTGKQNAGESLAEILAHRDQNATKPLQMCDGLAVNAPEGFATILGNCLDHARRKYKDVEAQFPEEVSFVLQTLAYVYKNDADAKAANMSPLERLAWHQEKSAPHMQALKEWAENGFRDRTIEPNSLLGGSVKYMLKRWETLTAFLSVPNMPLSSAAVERLIKRSIRHRKNSLHYKTERGAKFGDRMMTLIQTCRSKRVNSHQYLSALAQYKTLVCINPGAWLPWNFTETMATIQR